jgi:hypothetical protein
MKDFSKECKVQSAEVVKEAMSAACKSQKKACKSASSSVWLLEEMFYSKRELL